MSDDVRVPPRAEVDLSTKIVFRDGILDSEDSCWGTQRSSVVPVVHKAQTAIPDDRWLNIPVRAVNTTAEEAQIPAGKVCRFGTSGDMLRIIPSKQPAIVEEAAYVSFGIRSW